MKKIILGSFMAMVLLVFGGSYSASASELETLTKEEITERLFEITDKYEVGEPVSEEDAAFLTKYGMVNHEASPKRNISTYGLFDWNFTFKDENTSSGITVKVSGTCYVNLNNPLNNSYECNVFGSTTSGTVLVTIEHTGWGLLGSNLVGKVYEKTFSSSGLKYATINGAGDVYAAGVISAITTLRASATIGGSVVQAWESH